jgi:SAM-dependent methyltransferase
VSAAPPLIADELDLLAGWLPLDRLDIVELGCGAAALARALLRRFPDCRVTGLEVDQRQHAKNLAAPQDGLQFALGAAEAIPCPAASFDLALMLKSLHHVPVARMDAALAEIARVLAPGGFAYFSEPIYAGDFNAVVALFHDERDVREAAFAALVRAVESGRFVLAAERFWRAKRRFAGFAEFDERLIRATHTEHRLSDATYAKVRERFLPHLAADGTATFDQPMRVDVLRRRG